MFQSWQSIISYTKIHTRCLEHKPMQRQWKPFFSNYQLPSKEELKEKRLFKQLFFKVVLEWQGCISRQRRDCCQLWCVCVLCVCVCVSVCVCCMCGVRTCFCMCVCVCVCLCMLACFPTLHPNVCRCLIIAIWSTASMLIHSASCFKSVSLELRNTCILFCRKPFVFFYLTFFHGRIPPTDRQTARQTGHSSRYAEQPPAVFGSSGVPLLHNVTAVLLSIFLINNTLQVILAFTHFWACLCAALKYTVGGI